MATYRKLPSGNTQAVVRLAGNKPISKSFRSKALAQRWAIKMEDDLKMGITPAERVPTVDEAIDKYMKEISPLMADSSLSSREYQARMFKHLFGKYKLTEVTPHLLAERYAYPRLKSVSSDTLRRETSLLSQCFELYECSNPVPAMRKQLFQLRKLAPSNHRDRRLSDNEEHLLSSYCSYTPRTVYLYWVIQLILGTGLDRGEIIKLTRSLVGQEQYKLPRTKNSSKQALNREVILKQPEQECIYELSILSAHPVFLVPLKGDSLTQSFDRLCKKLNIPDLTLKDLRGECANRWVEKGIPIEFVASMLGNSISTCSEHYVNNLNLDLVRDKL